VNFQVGGSTGHCSIALAKTFPKLNFIVQDLPEAVAHADLTKETSRIQQQIAFVPHDFFQDQYIKAADVYLLRMILHDWPAKEAATILRHLVDAMGPTSKIILMDTVLPAPGEVPMYRESLLRVRDLTMMQVFNSSERSMEDWTELFENVDRRVKVKNLVQPQGSNMSVMELVLEDAGMENKA
jgi:6-hydroxytryprostatin B O-methyltransferase